jgi:CheY-like chemotaxis protein
MLETIPLILVNNYFIQARGLSTGTLALCLIYKSDLAESVRLATIMLTAAHAGRGIYKIGIILAADIDVAYRILIVEDDALTRRNLCVLLSEEGYEVDEVGDGLQALEILAQRQFDLVLSDIVMPRMDGLKLLDRLQFVAPQMPVMIMTSYLPGTSSTVPAGAAGLIPKPFLLEDLLFKVQRVLRKPVQSANH